MVLVDLAAFSENKSIVLDQCLLTVTRLLASYLYVKRDCTYRWGYRIINSQHGPEAFATQYKKVFEQVLQDFPADSPLQKGRQIKGRIGRKWLQRYDVKFTQRKM
jgi:hypothetical protein